MSDEKVRVDFNAPQSLIERADSVAELLGTSRTRLLVNALENELESLAGDEEFCRRLSDAYYNGRVEYETVESILGREQAVRMKLLRASFDQSPAATQGANEPPSDDAFYDGEVPEWTGNRQA